MQTCYPKKKATSSFSCDENITRGAAGAPPRGARYVSTRYRQVPLGHLSSSTWGMPHQRHDGSRCVGHVASEAPCASGVSPPRGTLFPPRGFFFLRELASCSSAVRFSWGIGAVQRGTPSRSTRPVEPRPARERSGETRTRSRTYSKVRGTRPAFPLAYAPPRSPMLARSRPRRGGRGREAVSTRLTRNTRIVARHLRHSSRGHASWPRGRWKTPRGLRARVSAARARRPSLSALSPVLSFRLAIVLRREHQHRAVVPATIHIYHFTD